MSKLTLAKFAQDEWDAAKEKRLVFSHVYCEVSSSHSRVSAVLEAFCAAATAGGDQEGPVAISYLVPSPADVCIAGSRYSDAVLATEEKGNKLEFMTFASWTHDVRDRQILLLDADRSTRSSIDTQAMLDISQKLEPRAEKEGFRCLVVTVSGDRDSLVGRDQGPASRAYRLRGHELCGTAHDVDDWESEAAEIVKERLRARLATLAGVDDEQVHLDSEKGPIVVLLTRFNDARYIYEELRTESKHVEFECIMPWSNRQSIEVATRRSSVLKLVYIDDGVRMMPLIECSEVVVGPTKDQFYFDPDLLCGAMMLNAEASTEKRLEAAFSLSSTAPTVHTFPADEEQPPEALSPAFGPQLLHLQLGIISVCGDRHPTELRIGFPEDKVMLSESVRRLAEWGLVDAVDKSAANKQPTVTHPLGRQAARFCRFTPNINAAVLLGCISEDMTNAVANILVDMAVMVCQGPSAIFSPTTGGTRRRAADHMRLSRGPLAGMVHNGQLWLSVACLDAFRRSSLPEHVWPLIRQEVIPHIQERAAGIKQHLGIEEARAGVPLAETEVEVVEEQLVRAFIFNILLSDEAMPGSFAVDFISRVRLVQHTHDPLDWAGLREHSATRGMVAGVYTYLEGVLSEDFTTIVGYRPCDTTAVSLKAVSKVLGEYSGGRFLRPIWEPSTCLRATSIQTARCFTAVSADEGHDALLSKGQAGDAEGAVAGPAQGATKTSTVADGKNGAKPRGVSTKNIFKCI
ncbi:hypothetical protein FJTKL_14020 [Diaporthe vaccinii]|uniref:Uncharacterized protein n=1 Tax=Diaporthe vaccinii TaxID=105482 RepID=A0ABR4E9D3_9PEZI